MEEKMDEKQYRCKECGKMGTEQVFIVMVPNIFNDDDKTLYEELECPDCGSDNVERIEEG